MTTYLASSVLALLDQAQADVERHLAAGWDGRCVACRDEHPCAVRRMAYATFARYGRLPRRRPGLAGRGVDEGTAFGWFRDRTAAEVGGGG